jgi:hypothetical protein
MRKAITIVLSLALAGLLAGSAAAATFTMNITGAAGKRVWGYQFYIDVNGFAPATISEDDIVLGNASPAGWTVSFAGVQPNPLGGQYLNIIANQDFGAPTYLQDGELFHFTYTAGIFSKVSRESDIGMDDALGVDTGVNGYGRIFLARQLTATGATVMRFAHMAPMFLELL